MFKKLEIKEPVFEEYFKSNVESTCQWTNQKTNKLCVKKQNMKTENVIVIYKDYI